MATKTELTKVMTELFQGRGNSYALKILKSDGSKFFIPHRDEAGKDRELTSDVIAEHLSGDISIGVYPLDTDDAVNWAAVDFDGKEKGDPVADAKEVKQAFASKLGLISWMEKSQSGKGVHLWVFFKKKVPAKIVRKVLGSCIPEYNTHRDRTTSYDRIFPAQDSSGGGYGNLCAIPLNGKELVLAGKTAFIDDNGEPFTNQSDIVFQAHEQRNEVGTLVEASKKIPDVKKFDFKQSPISKQIPGGTKLLCPQGCAWLRSCKDRSETLPYPEWYAALTQFTRVEEGEILAHRFSEDHPGYTPENTTRQFQKALEADKPLLCTTVWDKFGDCFHSTAKVLLANGETLAIGDIVKNKLDVEVMSFNRQEMTLESKKILRWVEVPYRNQGWRYLSYEGAKQGPTVGRGNLCKERGAFVTGNHNILTKDGYKQVDQLTGTSKIQTNETEPNSLQQQVIVGALLGDSCLQKSPSERALLKFGHTYKQTKWLKLKISSLAGISFLERLYKAYKQTKESHRAWSKTSAYFGDLYEDWYLEQKKIVPRNIELTPLTLATWYLDDGTLSGRRLHLYTLGFDLEDVRYLQKCLKEQQNVVARVRETKKRQSYLEISNGRGEDTHHSFDRFMAIIAAYVPESMRYKLPKFIGYEKKQTSVSNRNSKTFLDDFDPRLWELGTAVKTSFRTPIVIQATPKRPTKMYCLEVADNHNFIVRNMVVSNCGKRCAHLGVYSPWQIAKVPLVKLDEGNKGKIYNSIEIADMSIELAKDIAEGKRAGVPWGYDVLDDATELRPGDLVIVAARRSIGKTAWAVDVALNGAKNDIPQLIFSIEMSAIQIGLRLLANLSEVDHTLITTGKLNEEQWNKVLKAKDRLDGLSLFIDDSTRDLDRMLDNAGEFVYKHGKGPIWIDYLQLIRKASTESKKEAVDRALDVYKQMGKILEVPVIALAQMNRLEESSESEVELDQWLKDSGDIEQTADVIIYLRGDRGPGIIPRKITLHKDRHREAGMSFKFNLQQNIFKFVPAGNWSPQDKEDEHMLFSLSEVPESLGL